MFSVRIVSLDHYMSKPIDELYFKKEQNIVKEWQEPVLRIFGTTSDGFKSCVHVHGVYPYIYVPYKGGENPERDALLLGASLDEVLKTSFNPKIFRYVFKVTHVSGIPLYGYHLKPRQFFKIYFYNPFHIRKAVDLLLSGAILGQKFQPHEAHVPYALQFMMDYNIYGMSFVTFSAVKYRRDPSNPDSLSSVREEDILSDKVEKLTWSYFEVDALASDILNRAGQKRIGVNPGLEALWEEEQERRRVQNRSSRITAQQSQSRPEVGVFPFEAMYKARLVEKLKEIPFQEPETGVVSSEPRHSYPAEIPENGSIHEASAGGQVLESVRDRENVVDVSGLIDERILTQICGSLKEKRKSESEEEMELDGLLGRDQISEEEEAELEDEEGVDMTQPLDSDEEVICGAEGNRDEPGSSGGDMEQTFWRNMADKIFQLDGAQESSSESEPDATSALAPTHGVSDGPAEPSPAWSCNIMSILSECSGCPTPSASCQTPRTFWFEHSPDWLPQNQDSWIWNKSGTPFSEFPEKSQRDSLGSNEFPAVSKEIDDLLSSPHGGEYFPTSSDASLCNLEPTLSPPSAVLTPASEADCSDVNFDSICENLSSPTRERKKIPFPDQDKLSEAKILISEEQKLLQVLKNFAKRKVAVEDSGGQLTLKQYIKDCKEIVSVDFKNLCNREMIIIEYKSLNKRSLRSKYLIKPLDKFLESWNSAERKSSQKRENEMKFVKEFNIEKEGSLRSNYVINVVGKRFADASTVQSVSNKLTVKSMEIVPEGAGIKQDRYNVNENVISRGKIKMKLIKSQRKNVENNLKRQRSERCGKLKGGEGGGDKRSGRRRAVVDKKTATGRKWKRWTEPDANLINEINSSFEEYFQSLVKRRNFPKKNKKNVIEEKEEDEEEEEEEEEGGEESSDDEKFFPGKERGTRDLYASCSADPIKFVTRFLSTFSRMPDVPPLSITLRLGSPRASAPIQVNLHPGAAPRYFGKEHGRKPKIENVDGPADGSSSEESAGGAPKRRPRERRKPKRGSHYKPLNLIVYGSTAEKKGVGRKRKEIEVEEDDVAGQKKRGKRSFPILPSQDRFDGCRGKAKSGAYSGGKKEKSSSGEVVRSDSTPGNLSGLSSGNGARSSGKASFLSGPEQDFIGDSDEERERRKSVRKKKSARWPRGVSRRIPQADTEAFVSSEEDEAKGGRRKEFRVVMGAEKVEEKGVSWPEGGSSSELGNPNGAKRGRMGLDAGPSGVEAVFGDNPLRESLGRRDFPGLPLSRASPSESESSATTILKTLDSPPPGASWSWEFSENSKAMGFGFSNSDDAGAGFVSSGDVGVASLSRVSGSKKIKPREKPLSQKEVVELMTRYDLIEGQGAAPFYGNPLDGERAVETRFRVLKIGNLSGARLKPFKSGINVIGTEERRNLLLKGRKAERWQAVGNEDVAIMPLAKPPSIAAVLNSYLVGKPESAFSLGKTSEKGKVKILKPLSPGHDTGSEEEVEMSVTMSSLSGGDGASGPARPSSAEAELRLKKGPLAKIKGIKRLSLVKALGGASEDGQPKPAEEGRSSREDNSFQIKGMSSDDFFGFSRSVEDLEMARFGDAHQYMSMLVMELHAKSRKDLRPDPDHDPIRALFYAMDFDSPSRERETGVVVVGERFLSGNAISELSVHYVPTEEALLEKFLFLLRGWDPEILAGYEVEMNSWGYLVQRGFVLGSNLLLLLGRVQTEDSTAKKSSDFLGSRDSSVDPDDVPKSVRHMKISGRIVLDVWRVLRHEVALTSYTFENVMYHLAHERHPVLSFERLSYYWEHPSQSFRHLVVEHFATRVFGLIRILDQLDFINRTSELSRLFGIQFYEVLSRGSQFRVESMMLRLAKPLNYVPVSPSVAQRAAMRAPASLPLILEPESLFYADPVIVLDFQSLYPSIIIAYNYCFSTCLGRVEKLGGREPFEFGCTQLQVPPEELKRLADDLTVSPAGVAFVRSNIRKGILPALLEKILETRLMVKKSMKENKENKALQKVLYARQMGLKLIANVTYGYTAANFSGRMPCIEVGDSVVSKGRETLHRAIQLVKATRRWGARVVYGDTDSLFVSTPGRSREEAFRIGAEIAEAVTRDNPKPVKLKLEKVYQPCILQTKKRYLGYKFESPEQEKPVFEAKGVETVRRDGCPATGKILEKALRILFDTRDVSLVKKYTVRQFAKLYRGRVNLQDLIFAKEYRGRKGYRPGACVPALQLAKQWTQHDKRAEPRVKERVPYVIVNGAPGAPLIRLVRSPADLISDPSLRINAVYYITKAIIPPMQRCFSLLGVDVASWYAEMPREYRRMYKSTCAEGQRRSTISQYFAVLECVVCSQVTTDSVCPKCEKDSQTLIVTLLEKIRRWERSHEGLTEMCRSCCGRPTELDCVSLDCPVLFRRVQARGTAEQGQALREILSRHL